MVVCVCVFFLNLNIDVDINKKSGRLPSLRIRRMIII